MCKMKLRPYQNSLYLDIHNVWRLGYKNALVVLPTGGGKTVLFSHIIKNHIGRICLIAHRQELLLQSSVALAESGVKHFIEGSKLLCQTAIRLHNLETSMNYIDNYSDVMVVGIDTLNRRKDKLKSWLNQVTLWVQDEAHHVLRNNKWGIVDSIFPYAKGLGVTANTIRGDGKGIGRKSDGLFDKLVQGPSMRELINQGFLTDYRIFAPPSKLNMEGVDVSSNTGDYNPKQAKKRIVEAKIVGDIVREYLKIAPGKLGITFAFDIAEATSICLAFNSNGVPAEIITAKTPPLLRREIIERHKRKDIKQLINVDIFGEGFNIPILDLVSMGRPTQSYNLFCQQFGRPLRPAKHKVYAILIDHVGNVERMAKLYGLPDAKIEWDMEGREKRHSKNNKLNDITKVKTCLSCFSVYDGLISKCPYCGHKNKAQSRSDPTKVDGDLTEISPEILKQMRGEIQRIDTPSSLTAQKMEHAGAPKIAVLSVMKQHRLRKEAQEKLRSSISLWAGHERAKGNPDDMSYRRFYREFFVDVLTAQSLNRKNSEELNTKIIKDIEKNGYR